MDRTTVLLALEPRMLRQLLHRALDADPEVVVVGAAGGDVVAVARRVLPDVAVLTLAGPDQVPAVGRQLLAEHADLTLFLLSDRIAGGVLCRGSPPRCSGLTLHSTDQILRAIREARSPR